MDNSIILGSIRGIQIGINYTWLIVFVLVAASLALVFFPQVVPGLGVLAYWALGGAASLLLFGSVLVHELAHSFVAQRFGIQVKSITLFIFGGVSNIQGEPKTPRDEAIMAGAGPLTSIGIGIVLLGLWFATLGLNPALSATLGYLYLINFLLAGFNLIPGFPLDGGRVFRALVWSMTGSLERATRIAAWVGRAIGYLFIFGGLFIIFAGDIISGLWLAFIGWFLSSAAEQSYAQVATQARLQGVKVSQMMNPHPTVVGPDVSLQELVDDYILKRNVRAFPVVQEGNVIGLVTLTDVRRVPRDQWVSTRVRQVMTTEEQLRTAQPRDSLDKVLRELSEQDVNQLPVVEGHHLVGLLSRSQVIRFIQLRDELRT